MAKKRPVVTMKYEFDLLFCKDARKRVATVISHDRKIDLLNDICKKYDTNCTHFLNQSGDYVYGEVVEIFNHWIDLAKSVVLQCYPIIMSTFKLDFLDAFNEAHGLKAALDFMHFLDDYLGVSFYHEKNGCFGILESSCMVPLNGVKEMSITEAEKLIRDKLHMNVMITSDL